MRWQKKAVCPERSLQAAARTERFFRERLGRMTSSRQKQATPIPTRETPCGAKTRAARIPRAETRQAMISGIPRSWSTPPVFARIGLLSSMTYRAIRQLAWRIDALARRLNVALRMPVTLKAPFHEQRVFSPGHRHLFHWSMARRALDSAVYVNAVIEIDEIRQIVHTRPLQRAILSIACADGLEHRTIRPHLRVAVHACLR